MLMGKVITMILGGTRSYIRVSIFNKVVKISGELLMNGHGFVAYKNSITSWEHPNEDEAISEEMKETIIAHILEESKKSNMKIEFE